MKDVAYIVIYHDGDNLQAKYVDLTVLQGPFGLKPETIGLNDGYMINAVIEVPKTEHMFSFYDLDGAVIVGTTAVMNTGIECKTLDLEDFD